MNVQIRIIDHKKVLITDAEFAFYQKLCREYDKPNFKGEQLFLDHFEADDSGIIIFVKPPSQRYSSLEVYTYLLSLMVNQHLRITRDQTASLVREATEEYKKLILEINNQKNQLEELKKSVEAARA